MSVKKKEEAEKKEKEKETRDEFLMRNGDGGGD